MNKRFLDRALWLWIMYRYCVYSKIIDKLHQMFTCLNTDYFMMFMPNKQNLTLINVTIFIKPYIMTMTAPLLPTMQRSRDIQKWLISTGLRQRLKWMTRLKPKRLKVKEYIKIQDILVPNDTKILTRSRPRKLKSCELKPQFTLELLSMMCSCGTRA